MEAMSHCPCRARRKTAMKICPKCGESKPVTEFRKDSGRADGLQSYCKPCHSASSREWERNNRDKVRAARRIWVQQNRDKVKEQGLRARSRHSTRERSAWRKLDRAVQAGTVVRPEECSECGAPGIPDGHHADYDRPLDVIWLCRACHKDLHRIERALQP